MQHLTSRGSIGGACSAFIATARRGSGSRERSAALKVSAEQDLDGVAIKVDISLADVKKGKKIGSGSFGDVFEAWPLHFSSQLEPLRVY